MDTPALPAIIPAVALPPLLLFPQTHVSICIPRAFYLRLREASLSEGGVLGITARDDPPAHHGSILPLGCVAKVCHIHHLPCGRATHIHLHGLQRFEVQHEWIEGDCGSVEIVPLDDPPGRLGPERRQQFLAAFRGLDLARRVIPDADSIIAAEHDDETLINRLCVESGLSPMDKYFLLEAGDLDQRSRRLLDLLRLTTNALRPAERGTPDR
jgi:Lon protease-like protein